MAGWQIARVRFLRERLKRTMQWGVFIKQAKNNYLVARTNFTKQLSVKIWDVPVRY